MFEDFLDYYILVTTSQNALISLAYKSTLSFLVEVAGWRSGIALGS